MKKYYKLFIFPSNIDNLDIYLFTLIVFDILIYVNDAVHMILSYSLICHFVYAAVDGKWMDYE